MSSTGQAITGTAGALVVVRSNAGAPQRGIKVVGLPLLGEDSATIFGDVHLHKGMETILIEGDGEKRES